MSEPNEKEEDTWNHCYLQAPDTPFGQEVLPATGTGHSPREVFPATGTGHSPRAGSTSWLNVENSWNKDKINVAFIATDLFILLELLSHAAAVTWHRQKLKLLMSSMNLIDYSEDYLF